MGVGPWDQVRGPHGQGHDHGHGQGQVVRKHHAKHLLLLNVYGIGNSFEVLGKPIWEKIGFGKTDFGKKSVWVKPMLEKSGLGKTDFGKFGLGKPIWKKRFGKTDFGHGQNFKIIIQNVKR